MKGWVSACAVALSLGGQAVAQPDMVGFADGYLSTEAGRPLYINVGGVPAATVLCGSECGDAAAAQLPRGLGRWTAVLVDADAALIPPWTTTAVQGGAQLSYRGKPLFTYTGDLAEVPVEVSRGWIRLPAIERDFLLADDPSLTAKPSHNAELSGSLKYPPAALRTGESGQTVLRMCVDRRGRPLFPQVAVSSGSARLDEASMRWAWSQLRMRPARRNEERVGVCAFRLAVDWDLPALEPATEK